MAKTQVKFPNPELADPSGLLAIGGDFEPETLLSAYRAGIFPWPHPVSFTDENDEASDAKIEMLELAWFCPPRRAILSYDSLHVSRSLRQDFQKTKFRFSFDQAFEAVIEACQLRGLPPTSDAQTLAEATWITANVKKAYTELHLLGHAHSIEAWDEDGNLAGGLYGVSPAGVGGGAFSAESMFFLKPNASKFCILNLMEFLHLRGLSWIDIQVMSPHLKALGAETLSRARFLTRLAQVQTLNLELFPPRQKG